MPIQHFPLYFYPSTIYMVDDNERFLKNSLIGLDPHFSYQCHRNPIHALEAIASNKSTSLNQKNIINSIDSLEADDESAFKHAISINLKPIYQQTFHANKKKDESVLIVDFAMPTMNGLELCEKLKNSPIKKLMITGQGDHRLAVEAFNDGLIDQFILKNEENFYEKLNHKIHFLHKEYFSDLTKPLFNTLSYLDNFCLHDEAVQSYLLDFLNKLNPSEAYLIDGSGSFLIRNPFGQYDLIAIKNENEMCELTQMVDDFENKKLAKQLSLRQHMLFFWKDEDYLIPPQAWQQFIFPCKKIQNSNGDNFFIAHIKNITL